MLGRNLGPLLLQQCFAPQLWMQRCCWMGAAGLSTATASRAAEATRTVRQQEVSGVTSRQGAQGPQTKSSESSGSKGSSKPLPAGHQYLQLTFDQLHQNIQQSLVLKNAQSEAKLRVLISKARTPEQIQATIAALRWNYMQRCRLRHVEPFGPEVLHELWRACRRAGRQLGSGNAQLGSNSAVYLLEQANTLGVKTSLGLCEEVIRSCLQQKDYVAASRAWLYASAYCSTNGPSPSAQSAAQTPTAERATAARAGTGLARQSSTAGWASKNIIRLYLSGMTEWLKQGGLGPKHQQRLRQEVYQLSDELTARGARVAWVHEEIIRSCLKQGDYQAANSAWQYAEACCSTKEASPPTEQSPTAAEATAAEAGAGTTAEATAAAVEKTAAESTAAEAGAGTTAEDTAAAGEETAAEATAAEAGAGTASQSKTAGWASENVIRSYLSGMTEWLEQGGLDDSHQQRLRREVQKLADELSARGVTVAAESSSREANEPSKKEKGEHKPADVTDKPVA